MLSHSVRRTAAILAAVIVLVLVFLLWRNQRTAFETSAVVTEVRKLNQLTTVRYTVQKITGLEEQTLPVGSERILLVLQATVEAGVDLASLRTDQVQRRSDGTVVLRLPEAQILHVSVDEKETKVWDRQKTWWTPWVPFSKDLEKRARMEGLDAARKTAIDMGILKQAERNAEDSIKGLMGLAGVKIIVIRASVT